MADITTTALVPVFTGTIQGQSIQLCDARTLHTFMVVLRDFSDWVKARIRKFGFVEGVDFLKIIGSPEKGNQTRGGNRKAVYDYHLTLDMAKELSMVENNEKGREARRYFIACEKRETEQSPALPYSMAPGQTLSADQAATLRTMLGDACKRLPKEQQGEFMTKGWAKLKSHFGVSYRQIPVQEFTDAVSLVSRHVVSFNQIETVPVAQLSIDEVQVLREIVNNTHRSSETVNATVERWALQLGQGNSYPVETFLPLWQAVNQKLAQRVEFSASRKAVQ